MINYRELLDKFELHLLATSGTTARNQTIVESIYLINIVTTFWRYKSLSKLT